MFYVNKNKLLGKRSCQMRHDTYVVVKIGKHRCYYSCKQQETAENTQWVTVFVFVVNGYTLLLRLHTSMSGGRSIFWQNPLIIFYDFKKISADGWRRYAPAPCTTSTGGGVGGRGEGGRARGRGFWKWNFWRWQDDIPLSELMRNERAAPVRDVWGRAARGCAARERNEGILSSSSEEEFRIITGKKHCEYVKYNIGMMVRKNSVDDVLMRKLLVDI